MHGTAPLSTLEVLHAAKRRLAGGERFDFLSYGACTCGHIYTAATGKRGTSSWDMAADADYIEIMEQACRALGINERGYAAVTAISDLTIDVAADRLEPGRLSGSSITAEDAITVIDRAIAAIEAQQERDRLDVLAQTKEIVDNAPVAAPVVA